ncbi:ABCC4 (predicted) [Pycnogonum litorale]
MADTNIFSKIFFGWTYVFLKKGYKGKLSAKDVKEIPRGYECNELTSHFKRGLKKSTEKKVTAMNLMQAIWYLNSRQMMASFALGALEEWILKPVIPIMLGLLLRQLNESVRDKMKELYIVLMFSFLSILQPFIFQHSLFLVKKSSVRAQNAIISLIYEKAMNLSHQGYSIAHAGQIVNFVTNDVNQFDTTFLYVKYIITSPVQSIIVAIILSYVMGSYSAIGLFMFLVLIGMQASIAKVLVKLRKRKLEATDKRLKLMNDILTGMKVIKMYGWEERFFELLADRRREECHILRRIMLLKSVNYGVMNTSTKLLILMTLILYIFGDNGAITAEKVFVMLSLFYAVRISITMLFLEGVTGLSEIYSSLDRISVFLNLDEKVSCVTDKAVSGNPRISAVHVHASWNKMDSFLNNINFNLQGNDFVTIVGPIGSGKTSVLMLILRELHVLSGFIDVIGSISYVPQDSWVFSDTIVNNITLGKEVDYGRINRILDCCALRLDVDSFPGGLETLVGERGIMLSGGQRSRLSLARALYQDADIYLFDDPLSAVDPEIGNQIYNQCIKNYLKDKLRVLVTHQIQYIRNDQKVILMNKGCIQASGTLEEISHYVEKWNIDLNRQNFNEIDSGEIERLKIYQHSSSKQDTDKELDKESTTDGGVPWKVYWNFFYTGGIVFGIFMIPLSNIVLAMFNTGSDYWLKIWTEADQNNSVSLNQTVDMVKKVNESLSQISNLSSDCTIFHSFSNIGGCGLSEMHFLLIFSILAVGTVLTGILSYAYAFMICTKAAKQLHDNMFKRMLDVPMQFFNVNPIGRILNRFAKDVGSVDDLLATVFMNFTSTTIKSIVVLVIVCIQNYYLIFPVILMVLLFLPISYLFLPTYQALKRICSSNRSPIFGHVSTSLDGRTSIRAFNAVHMFKSTLSKLQNDNIASSLIFGGVESWFSFSGNLIETLNTCISTAVPVFLTQSSGSGTVGFIVSQVAQITASAQFAIKSVSALQSEFTSVERIMEYGNLEPEASKQSSPDKKPQPSWPQMGTITFKRVSLRYKQTDQYVLKSLTFKIKGEEKVGIVGRTGSGKTSLINALFRLVEPVGIIEIDGVVVNDIGLHDLRHKLSVIPQEPLLFADTLRYNLDPFNEHDDLVLWNALKDVGLGAVVADFPDKLNTMMGGHTNLSYGQSQLICLARAILKKNKILILDEATSNVDQNTDVLIQKTIRLKFKECTVITVAHRLNTIIDSDRIMVLDGGRIVEFDSPYALANNEESKFHKMIEDSGPAAKRLLRKSCTSKQSNRRNETTV